MKINEVFLLYRDNSDKENTEIRVKLKQIPENESLILVATGQKIEECFAVIDDEIVWHGGMNLLGKADVWDNLMRIRNSQVATELLEIALGCSEERSFMI